MASARQALLAQGRKASQRAVIKHLGGGSFSQVGPLLRELESDAGEVPGSALTEPLAASVTEAIETLWRALGLEADRVVNDARQQFERDLKAEQAARAQAEAATVRTQEHLQAAQTTLIGLEKALASEQSAREQTTAALEQERLAHARTDTQREAAQALAAERQQLRDEALAERDGLRVELDSVRRQTDELTQALRREIGEQRSAHEKRVDALNEAATAARTSLAEQRSQLDALQRENTNLTTLNSGLSVRIDNTQSSLASTEAQLSVLNAQRTAEQRERETLQSMMTSRLADKDELIASLQQQIAEPPNDPDAPVENDTGGV
ncbi:DNA-binding protein [Granulosicoccus antarcticus]|uniref:DNA-binding protein n=1 Tax=Granulosicoccus antarcticus TaxID=437505 RepID=UPI0012FE154D|nr:DNA-binding protein [Granulosicoccus antarcticus]